MAALDEWITPPEGHPVADAGGGADEWITPPEGHPVAEAGPERMFGHEPERSMPGRTGAPLNYWGTEGGNEAMPSPAEIAARRTKQSVRPNQGRQISDVTRMPEATAASMVHGATVGPFQAWGELNRKRLNGEIDISDPETAGQSLGAAGIGLMLPKDMMIPHAETAGRNYALHPIQGAKAAMQGVKDAAAGVRNEIGQVGRRSPAGIDVPEQGGQGGKWPDMIPVADTLRRLEGYDPYRFSKPTPRERAPAGGGPAAPGARPAPTTIDLNANPGEPSPPATGPMPRPGMPNLRLLPPDFTPQPRVARGSVGAASTGQTPLDLAPTEARNAFIDMMKEQGLTPYTAWQRFEEMSPQQFMGELTRDTEGHMQGIASSPGQSRNEITEAVRQRHREQPQRIQAIADRGFGPAVNRTEWDHQVQEARKAESGPFWTKFDNTPIPPTLQIDELLPTLEADGFLKAANDRLRREKKPATQGFINPEEAAKTQFPAAKQYPTARAYQLVKESIDDEISAALKSGKKGLAGSFLTLKNELLNAIDNHPDPNVAGTWKQARTTWARHTELLTAYEIGENLLNRNSDFHWSAIPRLMESMSDPAKQAVAAGMRGHIEDTAMQGISSEFADHSNPEDMRIIRELLAGANRKKIEAFIGDKKASELVRDIEHELIMRGAPTRLIGGSPTGEKLAYQKRWAPPEGKMQQIGEALPGAIANPVHAAGKLALSAARKVGLANAEARYQKLREGVAPLFTVQKGGEGEAMMRQIFGPEPIDTVEPAPPQPVTPAAPSAAAAPAGPLPAEAHVSPAAAGPSAPAGPWRPVSAAEAETLRAAAAPVEAPPVETITQTEGPKEASLFQFLAKKGIKDTPESRQYFGGQNPLVPGRGHLLRKDGGLPLDRALEAASEARYLAENTERTGGKPTMREFGQALEDEYRSTLPGGGGRKRYPAGAERTKDFDTAEADKHFEDSVFHAIESEGLPRAEDWPEPVRKRTVELARQGMGSEDAYMKAVMEYDRHEEGMAEARHEREGTAKASVSSATKQRSGNSSVRGTASAHGESENPAEFKTGGKVDNSRQVSHYAPDAGTATRHCGPLTTWPKGSCAMFREPGSCTAVAGVIAKRGACRWWEKK